MTSEGRQRFEEKHRPQGRRRDVKVMRSSEGIDPDDDLFEPQYVSIEYDDEAFYDAMNNSDDGPEEDDE
ncbi:hypothetical protein [Streptomyces sp. NPDC001492]